MNPASSHIVSFGVGVVGGLLSAYFGVAVACTVGAVSASAAHNLLDNFKISSVNTGLLLTGITVMGSGGVDFIDIDANMETLGARDVVEYTPEVDVVPVVDDVSDCTVYEMENNIIHLCSQKP